MKKISRIFWGALFGVMFLVNIHSASSQLKVGVKGGNFNPISIAIPNFRSDDDLGKKITKVIHDDLERSGLFIPLDENLFIDGNLSLNQIPTFANWQKIDAHGLVVGEIRQEKNNTFAADIRLWDVVSKRQLIGKTFQFTQNSWRRVSHVIADEIYSYMTGEMPYFNTSIAFIDESGPATRRVKRLAIMNQDGDNLYYLTNGKELVVTPRFSPKGQLITYMAYVNGVPRVYIQNLNKATRQLVGTFPNMTIAPRFSFDGKKIIMSLLNNDGSANLYEMDLGTRKTRRLTFSNAIDTSASYSPDDKKIVFSSDRNGKPALFVMDSDGSNIQKISKDENSYLTPVWSPRGDYIAFTKMVDGVFSIGIMRPDGSNERILTSGFHNEGPTWAPNGRVLMFFRQNIGQKDPNIYSIDITGRNERKIKTPRGASDPAWSALLD